MFNKYFIQIKKSKKLIRLKKLIFFSIILEIIVPAIFSFNFENKILKFFFISFILFWAIMNFISGFFISSYKKIGKLSLNDDKITFNNNLFDLKSIKKIIVRLNDYQGEPNKGMYIGIGSAYPQEGTKNFIELNLNNGKEYKLQILLKYKKDINIIYKILRYYHNTGINVEFYKKDKKILLK